MVSSSFVLVFILSACWLTAGRLSGRRLRDWEPCDAPGYFGDADDCRKFYRCAEHPTEDENNPLLLKYAFRCPSGTVFDEALSTCNHPEAVPNKPENCQVYDPEEPTQGENNGDGNGNNGGQLLRQSVLAPQLWFPSLTIPHNNIIYLG
ncbi:Endochitinase [Orchesella cincta]|uniref:Endochitinase n=1 Tax=Orchesella cincta TaxID=48709 RepID=A0A1D2N587_ORCCI|nr:Endochitinase [Orchesella cincta]